MMWPQTQIENLRSINYLSYCLYREYRMNKLTQLQYKAKLSRRLKVYAFLGPLFGLIIIDLGMLTSYVYNLLNELHLGKTSSLDIMQHISAFLGINMIGIFVAYATGIVPATIAGLIALKCRETIDECAVAALIGATPFLVAHFLHSPPLKMSIALILAITAALSGIACGLFHRK